MQVQFLLFLSVLFSCIQRKHSRKYFHHASIVVILILWAVAWLPYPESFRILWVLWHLAATALAFILVLKAYCLVQVDYNQWIHKLFGKTFSGVVLIVLILYQFPDITRGLNKTDFSKVLTNAGTTILFEIAAFLFELLGWKILKALTRILFSKIEGLIGDAHLDSEPEYFDLSSWLEKINLQGFLTFSFLWIFFVIDCSRFATGIALRCPGADCRLDPWTTMWSSMAMWICFTFWGLYPYDNPSSDLIIKDCPPLTTITIIATTPTTPTPATDMFEPKLAIMV